MAFALNLQGWYIPYQSEFTRTEKIIEEYDCHMNLREIANVLAIEDIEYMQSKFDKFKVISWAEMELLPKDVEVIAYRVGVDYDESIDDFDTDFHFKVRRDGVWYEKCGDGPVEPCELLPFDNWLLFDRFIDEDGEYTFEEDEDSLNFVYNGPIYYMIKTA